MPALADANFAQTVTFIWEHNADGALGIIINRPLQMRLADVFEQLKMPTAQGIAGQQQVLQGGPVQTDRGFVVHHVGTQWEHTKQISSRIQVTTSPDILTAMAQGTGPDTTLVALGYAGWSAGQLESEIAEGAWYVVESEPDDVFGQNPDTLWRRVLRRQNDQMAYVATYPDDPTMN